jgi:tetratricopeptide (TPR) repeat protein
MDKDHLKNQSAKIAKQVGMGLAGAVLIVVAVKTGGWLFKALGVRHLMADAAEVVGHPFESVQAKVDSLARAMDENERLRLENAHLKLRVEGLQFDCQSRKAEKTTRSYELKLDPQTGSQIGRTLASIGYRIPDQLAPDQLYVLGVSYFRAGENEKAAALLTFLTNLEDHATYRNPRDWLMTGVAWYRLENFEAAGKYFEKVVQSAGQREETHAYHAQALLWKALTASRTGKKAKAQYWLRELLDHHPYSREAQWVNAGKFGKREKRVPAGAKSEAHDAPQKHQPKEEEHAAHPAQPAHGH